MDVAELYFSLIKSGRRKENDIEMVENTNWDIITNNNRSFNLLVTKYL